MVAPSHLKSLQALELAVRTGSFKAAADALAITPAAVGQRVKALEDYLGMELLVRGRSGILPSPELIGALPHLSRAFHELDNVARELELQRGHELQIAALSDFVELWLKPRLPRFRAAHPNILFCINGEGEAPIRLGQVDCQIGYGPLPADGSAELLFRDFVLPISSPLNCERTGAIEESSRLEGFPLLHLDFYKDDPGGLSWPSWIAGQGIRRTSPDRGIRFQRITAALDAVLANAGVTMCGLALIGDMVEDGRVSLPYPVTTGMWSRFGFTARFRTDWGSRVHVSRFRSWLLEESRLTSEWLARISKAGRAGPPDQPVVRA